MSLNESDLSVADGNNSILLDQLGVVALEEGIGSGSLITDNSSDHVEGLVFVLGVLCADDFHVDVVPIPTVLEGADLNKHWLLQFAFHWIILNNKYFNFVNLLWYRSNLNRIQVDLSLVFA